MIPASTLIVAGTAEPSRPWPRYVLTPDSWRAMADALPHEPHLSLQALWADTTHVHALFFAANAPAPLLASTPVEAGLYAALSPYRPAAAWFERMILDLWGHRAANGTDGRAWLDHGCWAVLRPMSSRPAPNAGPPDPPEFLAVEGEDLHQVPVGPVHASIIEPGHFRITAQGETIVRLETRLGYTHKGTLLLMRGKSPRAAARFAARLSGDCTVAHAIAFARAAEAATDTKAPPRADALRAVMAELERVANHTGDVGAVCQDAAFAYPNARCGLLREAVLRASDAAFGHRLMMDAVVPGGIAADIAPEGADAIRAALDQIVAEWPALLRAYDDTASLADRVVGTGVARAEWVARFAPGGFVGRAAGRAFDARRTPGYPPYDTLPFVVPVLREGDVDARVRIRLLEVPQSIALLRTLLATLPPGPVGCTLPNASGEGVGVAEGFRGDVWHWLRLDSGSITSAFARDPSWLHWPLVEAAVEDAIVADFPLVNKSFNASYSGVDL